ncbi:MAG: hypothetical protein HYW77_03465 [Parcubacteria group bacterium]|nr:hypothetical protein [Parcubacteria group bacterium]
MKPESLNPEEIVDQIIKVSGVELDQAESGEARAEIQQQLERAIWEAVLTDLDDSQVKRFEDVLDNTEGEGSFEDKIAEITAEVPGLAEKIESRLAQEIDTIVELLQESSSTSV